MKYGVWLWPAYRDGLPLSVYRELASSAEALGYESVWTGHHLAMPAEVATPYHASEDGASPHDSFQHRFDPLMLLSDLARETTSLKLGTGVFLLPLTSLFATARSVMTADHISNGRIIFGVGVGWCREEFDVLGVDFETRGRRTDEMVAALKKLWVERVSEHHSELIDFGPVGFEPKPKQAGGPPILGSGLAPAALSRSAGLNGVFLPTDDVAVVRRCIETVRSLRGERGLDSDGYEITVPCPMPPSPQIIRELADAGVNRVVIYPDGYGLSPAGTVPVATPPAMSNYLLSIRSLLPGFAA